jgi:hypothetical protein
MRRIAIIIISLLFVCLSDTTAFACGDKFLLVGRGARYQRGYTAVHPASILLYASTPATSQRSLQSALKLAGHRVVVAATRGELDAALRSGRFDLVLADSNETATVEEDLDRMPIKPVMVGLTDRHAVATGQKKFCVITAEKRQRRALAILDEVLDSTNKGQPPRCEPAK